MKNVSLFLFSLCFHSNIFSQAPGIEWQKCFGGSSDDAAYSIYQTRDSGFIFSGKAKSNDGDVSGNHGDYDCWIVKITNNGTLQWQKSLGGSGEDVAQAVKQTVDGGFIFAGYSNSTNGDVTGNQ